MKVICKITRLKTDMSDNIYDINCLYVFFKISINGEKYSEERHITLLVDACSHAEFYRRCRKFINNRDRIVEKLKQEVEKMCKQFLDKKEEDILKEALKLEMEQFKGLIIEFEM